MILTGGKPKELGDKKKAQVPLCPIPKRTDLKLKPGVRSERPVTKLLSHCTRPALHYIWTHHRQVAMANEFCAVVPKICGSRSGTCCMSLPES